MPTDGAKWKTFKLAGVFLVLIYIINNLGIISGPDVSEQTC